MQIQFDLKKFDPKFWMAMAALFGFANMGDLISWVGRAFFGPRPAYVDQAVSAESKARAAADSALLDRINVGQAKDSASNARVEKAVDRLAGVVLKIPQVQKYADEEARADSIRRKEERRRQFFLDRESRGAGIPRGREFQ